MADDDDGGLLMTLLGYGVLPHRYRADGFPRHPTVLPLQCSLSAHLPCTKLTPDNDLTSHISPTH